MSVRTRILRAALGVLVSAMVAGCSAASTSTTPQVSSPTHTSSVHRFALATQSVKAMNRPSITSRSVVYCHTTKPCDNFHLVTSVAINDDGTFAGASDTCDSSIFDAPWYIAQGTFTLPLAPQTIVPYCAPPAGTVMPTPVPGAGYYLVKIDIGWLSLNAGALAGPSVVGKVAGGSVNNGWLLPALATDDAFQDGHLYAFFIAIFNGSLCPVPVAAS